MSARFFGANYFINLKAGRSSLIAVFHLEPFSIPAGKQNRFKMRKFQLKEEQMAPLSEINDFSDGQLYVVQPLHFKTNNLYMDVAVVGDLVYKQPSRVGQEDFYRFIECEEHGAEMIRPLEPFPL